MSSEQNLESLLQRLAELTPAAQQRWEAQQRQDDDGFEPSPDKKLWLTLERFGPCWWCGWRLWRVGPTAASYWAFVANGVTPTEAAAALLCDEMGVGE